MKSARRPALYLVHDISDDIRKRTFTYPLTEGRLTNNGYKRNKIPNQGVGIKGLDWANVSSNWIADLSSGTAMFVMKNIIPAMKKYNLLWHWAPAIKRSEKMAIKELVEKKLLFRTETIGIYLVNPIKIWKGDPITCIEATKNLLREHRKPSIDLIHDIRPGAEYTHELPNEAILKLIGDGLADLGAM